MEQTQTVHEPPNAGQELRTLSNRPGVDINPGEADARTGIVDHSQRQNGSGRLIRRILVPTDFSSASEEALCRAMVLGSEFQSTLTLLHVVDIGRSSPLGSASDFMKNLWAEGLAQLSRLASRVAAKTDARTMIVEGLPWEVIAEKSQDFDLLILGQRGGRSRGKLFCRHITQRVLEDSFCPVIVVPERH